jgi:hypothetical protein
LKILSHDKNRKTKNEKLLMNPKYQRQKEAKLIQMKTTELVLGKRLRSNYSEMVNTTISFLSPLAVTKYGWKNWVEMHSSGIIPGRSISDFSRTKVGKAFKPHSNRFMENVSEGFKDLAKSVHKS